MCAVFVDSSRKEVFSEENFSSHIKQFAESIVNQIDNAELLQENYENDFSAYVSNFIDAYEVQTAEDIVNAFRDKVIKLASEESIPCAYFDGKLFYIADARGEYEDAMDYARLSWQKYFKLCGEKHPDTKVIGERAFQDCKSLISVQLPCSLNKIGADAFSGCARLEEITIPNGVTFIGNNAFNSCGSLKTISIPASVETIEYFAFAFCGKLESVEILGSLDEIAGGTFQSCYRLREVKIHGTVTTISDGDGGHGAFQMCKKLANVNQILKDSIKKIGKYSFRWCENLQSVTIPSSVTDIGIQIFNGCTNLKEIRYKRGLRSADKLNDGNSARLVPY